MEEIFEKYCKIVLDDLVIPHDYDANKKCFKIKYGWIPYTPYKLLLDTISTYVCDNSDDKMPFNYRKLISLIEFIINRVSIRENGKYLYIEILSHEGARHHEKNKIS